MTDLDELRIPRAARPYAEKVVAMTDGVCLEHLDEEYGDMCRRLVGRLARKRPSPLTRGDHGIWAAGVVYCIGQLNFLSDPSQVPHATADKLSELFGVKKGTMANKARQIREMLNLEMLDVDLTRQQLVDRSALTWMLEVDGLVVDARDLPLELQVLAYQQGVIPYVPALGRRG